MCILCHAVHAQWIVVTSHGGSEGYVCDPCYDQLPASFICIATRLEDFAAPARREG